MKKKIGFLVLLILAGTAAYFGGYEVYTKNNPKTEISGTVTLQHKAPAKQMMSSEKEKNGYLGMIEQKNLNIYRMPEYDLYDTVNTDTLHLTEQEEQQLMEGMRFQSLTEVFEFLENSMT